MATTQNTYTGNGSTTNYSFTFPYLETTDIKVSVNGTPTTAYTLANATTVQFNSAPANGASIRIYRETDDTALSSAFYAGSAIRAEDLTDNFNQSLYVVQELNNYGLSAVANETVTGSYTFTQPVTVPTPTADTHAVTRAYVNNIVANGIGDGDKGDVTVSGSGSTITIDNLAVTTAKLDNSAVTSSKIANDTIVDADINSAAGISLSKLATGALPTLITVASANLVDGTIVDADVNSSAGIVSTKLSFTQAGTGAAARTVDSKLKDVVSVKDFGAVGDGVADDTAAFSLAAKGAPARVNIVGAEAALPRAPMCRVFVPSGEYVLTSTVDTGNREVVWQVDLAATITGQNYINGEIIRVGQRQVDSHHGTTDYACGYSIRAHTDLENGAEVLGITSASQLATYTDRDSVGLYVDNLAPAATYDVGTATYTSTTATIAAPSATVLRELRRGMVVDTKHSPKWSGILDSWNANGTILTVTNWYQVGGGGTPGTPADGTGLVINGFTKVWAHNANVFLQPTSLAARACGFELGVLNNKGALNFGTQQNYIWGYDAVNLGTYEGAVGFIARPGASAAFFRGFQCSDATQAGFYVGGTPTYGFWTEQTAGDAFNYTNAGATKFKVDATGNVVNTGNFNTSGGVFIGTAANASLSLGSTGSANTPFIDFNSSGNNIDYDVRILASSGDGSNGNGLLTVTAGAGTRFAGIVSSNQDNVHSLGTAALRWSVVYAGTGTINTSDERTKQDIEHLDEAELRVATTLKGLVRKFRFKDAVEAKGPDARIHIGVIAQDVIAAFQAEGLNPMRYSIVCYDEWDAESDADGNEIFPAGSRLGIRYEELLAFIISTL